MTTEQEEFLKDTERDPNKVDVFDQPLVTTTPEKEASDDSAGGSAVVTEDEDEKDDGLKPRNRRERRLAKALEEERQSASFLAGKLEARTEAQKAVTEEADYLKSIERIYGTESPEAQLATELLKKAIVGARDDAENRAYERIKSERQKELEEERKAEAQLDSIIEEIEEGHGVTFTATQEAAYLQLLEKMSPKDKQGNVIEFADPEAVWEVFEEKLKKPDSSKTRVKDLSSRSMVSSGASTESNLEQDVHSRFLREQGII